MRVAPSAFISDTPRGKYAFVSDYSTDFSKINNEIDSKGLGEIVDIKYTKGDVVNVIDVYGWSKEKGGYIVMNVKYDSNKPPHFLRNPKTIRVNGVFLEKVSDVTPVTVEIGTNNPSNMINSAPIVDSDNTKDGQSIQQTLGLEKLGTTRVLIIAGLLILFASALKKDTN